MSHYVESWDRDTCEGYCIYEVHYRFAPDSGYAIRFVEGPDTYIGQIHAIEAALDDMLAYFSEDTLQAIEPILTGCHKHPSWRVLYQKRHIRPPSDDESMMRGPKRATPLEDALEFVQGLPELPDE